VVARPGQASAMNARTVEQQDAADEAGASHGASPLILVFSGPLPRQRTTVAWRSLIGSAALTLAASLPLTADIPRAISSEKCSAAFATRRLGGHAFRSHPAVLRVRYVRGTITSEVGPWPAGTPVLFQVFGPASRPVVRSATAASDGTFLVNQVPAGHYCFEASANGWDPVGGLLEVSNKTPSEAAISLSLPLAQ
jgi:hypothetical protein